MKKEARRVEGIELRTKIKCRDFVGPNVNVSGLPHNRGGSNE
jgi:hypothetical protein